MKAAPGAADESAAEETAFFLWTDGREMGLAFIIVNEEQTLRADTVIHRIFSSAGYTPVRYLQILATRGSRRPPLRVWAVLEPISTGQLRRALVDAQRAYRCDPADEATREGTAELREHRAFWQGEADFWRRQASISSGAAKRWKLWAKATWSALRKGDGLKERWVTADGCTRLPEQMRAELKLNQGGHLWFLKGEKRWEAWTEAELQERLSGEPSRERGKTRPGR